MDEEKMGKAIPAMLIFSGLVLVNFCFACYGFASYLLSKGKIEHMITGVIIWIIFTLGVYLISFYNIVKELAEEA